MGPDLRELQEAELDALRAIYPEEGSLRLDQGLPRSADGDERYPGEASAANAPSSLSGTVILPDIRLRKRPVGLRFHFPKSYPEQSPVVQVLCEAGISQSAFV